MGTTNTKSFELGKARLSFENSKGFFVFSIVGVSSTIRFSRVVIDEEIVDSPPNKEIGQIPLCSPSSLKSWRKDGLHRSLTPKRYRGLTHLRQLYGSGPLRVSIGLDMTNASESSPVMEWMLHKFGQKLSLTKTRLLDICIVNKECLLYSTQETSSKRDNIDAVSNVHGQRPSDNCKLWRRREQTLNLTTHVKELDGGKKHQIEVVAYKDGEAPLHQILYVYYIPH